MQDDESPTEYIIMNINHCHARTKVLLQVLYFILTATSVKLVIASVMYIVKKFIDELITNRSFGLLISEYII